MAVISWAHSRDSSGTTGHRHRWAPLLNALKAHDGLVLPQFLPSCAGAEVRHGVDGDEHINHLMCLLELIQLLSVVLIL